MLNRISRQVTDVDRSRDINDLIRSLAIPRKPAALQVAEAGFASASAAVAAKEKEFAELVRTKTFNGATSLPTSQIRTWNDEIEELRTSVRAAGEARAAARQAFAGPFVEALALPNERAKVVLSDLMDDLESVIGRLAEINRSAVALGISPPRAVAAAPALMSTLRQFRRLIGRAA
jgi:hypothetical protein